MEETLNYIKVLNWGYEGFAPMTLNTDFEKSLQQVRERLGLLDSLNYGALFVEATSANGKANLHKYQSTDDTIEYNLHFLRDRKEFLEMLQPDYLIEIDKSYKPHRPIWQRNPKRMFRWAFDAIDKFKADGVWTDEQWREYRWTLSEIEKGLEDRLKQFLAAYELTPASARRPKNIRGGGRKPSKDKPRLIQKYVSASDIKGEQLCGKIVFSSPNMIKDWCKHLLSINAIWESVDDKILIKALRYGDIGTIATGTNKKSLVGFFKIFAFNKGYGYAENQEQYKRVCIESSGMSEYDFKKSGIGNLSKEKKKALFPGLFE